MEDFPPPLPPRNTKSDILRKLEKIEPIEKDEVREMKETVQMMGEEAENGKNAEKEDEENHQVKAFSKFECCNSDKCICYLELEK